MEDTTKANIEMEKKIQELEEELECCAGPNELYDKLAGGSNYLPPMGFLETVDNSCDAGAKYIWCELDKDIYKQQDDGNSFFVDEKSNTEKYNKEELSEDDMNDIKSLIKKRLSPLKEILHESTNSIGFNNWGLKGELAYHNSNASIYSWNSYWFVLIVINLQEQRESNKWGTGLNINIFKKNEIPDDIRQQFQRRLISKENKWQNKSGTLIYELFTDNKPNIIKQNESGHTDISQNHLLWTKQWFRRRYFMQNTDLTLIFNGEKLKPLNIENEIPEEKKENRIKKNELNIFKRDNYLYYSLDGKFVKGMGKYNLIKNLKEDCDKKKEWIYINEQHIIGKVCITSIMCNTLENEKLSKKIRSLYNEPVENANNIKIILDNIIIAEENSLKTDKDHFKHIFTFMNITNTFGKKDLKKLILKNCTITKQQGMGNSIFYKPCYETRKIQFKDENKYFAWNKQVKMREKQDITIKDYEKAEAENEQTAPAPAPAPAPSPEPSPAPSPAPSPTPSPAPEVSETTREPSIANLLNSLEIPNSNPINLSLPPKENLTSEDWKNWTSSQDYTDIQKLKKNFNDFISQFE